MPDAMPYRNTALQLARNYLKCISGSDIVGAALLSARIDRVKPVFDETLVVPGAGIEPARLEGRGILSPVRLPVPPSRHGSAIIDNSVFMGNRDRPHAPI